MVGFIKGLVPRRKRDEDNRPLFAVLREISAANWFHFFCGWLAWTCDALDFFCVSLSVTHLSATFHRSTHDITTAITLTLLFRAIGAVIFGTLSDRYGRKYPLIANLALCAIFSLGTGFVQTYGQFLVVRALFGVAMGGVWSLATCVALENLPAPVRGLASGIIQQGYAVGNLLAAALNIAFDTHWRNMFYTAAGVSAFATALSILLPESQQFVRAKKIEDEKGVGSRERTKTFFKETWVALKGHWLIFVYIVCLVAGLQFLAHGSQDLYPTYLQETKNLSARQASLATITGSCGAIVGGAAAGLLSQHFGRRLVIVLFALITAVFIPLWILPDSFGALTAGAFCIQFGIQGAFGIAPIQLSEVSPPAFRASFVGVAYQIGNMVSAASAQIEATGGAHLKKTIIKNGKPTIVPDDATVQGILIGTVAAFVIIVTLLGPEKHSAHFERHKTAFEEGAAHRDALLDDEPESAGASVDGEGDEKVASRSDDGV